MAREQLGPAPSIAAHATTKGYADSTFTQRSKSTITGPTTLGAAAAVEYVTNISSTDTAMGNVVALIHGEGANNSTTMTDTSPLGSNWTPNGNVKITTATSKYGTSSITFDGTTGTYITPTAASSNFAIGTGDFCIEMWIRPTTVTTNVNRVIVDFRPLGTEGLYPCIYYHFNGNIRYYVNVADRITGTTTLSLNTWYHVAVARSNGSTRLFINGTQEGSTYTDSNNYLVASALRVGSNANANDTSNFIGQMDDLRITNGTARYTANFSVPTALFPDAPVPTLPTAVGNTSVYVLKNTLTGIGNITLATTSGQTIDGAASLTIPRNYSVRLDSDGSNWRTSHTTALTATTAGRLTTPRTISLSGNASGSVAFDGSGDISIPVNSLGPNFGVANSYNYGNIRHINNANTSGPNDGMFIGYDNGSGGLTRIFGGGDGGNGGAPLIVRANGKMDHGWVYDGNARFSCVSHGNGHGAVFATQDNSYGMFAAYFARTQTPGNVIAFYYGGTNAGWVYTNGSAVSYNSASDYRLKENVAPLVSGTELIKQLRPVSFNWISSGDYGEGFIAHELQDVIPEAVQGVKDAELEDGSIVPQGVDLAKVVPHLVSAVQELTARLEAAEARIAQLEGNVNG